MVMCLPATEPGPPEIPFDIPFASGQRAVDPDFRCISNSVGDRRIFEAENIIPLLQETGLRVHKTV
ncbi:MAG: hypothetical protein LBJ01_10810 [Tannerella sp.]|jgi:hypothetical protein|nr:hypothetical protein [Tannerella sp.]